jgi:hypothetical protein
MTLGIVNSFFGRMQLGIGRIKSMKLSIKFGCTDQLLRAERAQMHFVPGLKG